MSAKNKSQSILFLVLAGCIIQIINSGIRSNYGVLVGAIMDQCGVSYETVSFVMAVGQLFYGIAQPLAGMLALKKTNGFVLKMGAVSLISGLALLPFARNLITLLLPLGILMPTASGAMAFGILMSILTPQLPKDSVSTVSGIISASGGIGSSMLATVLKLLCAAGGLTGAVLFLGVPALLLLPVSVYLCRPERKRQLENRNVGQRESAGTENFVGNAETGHIVEDAGNGQKGLKLGDMLKGALKTRDYLCLTFGFFTCGFHMAIIETHLYSQIDSFGLGENTAALAFSVYGIATMIGSLASGTAGRWVSMKNILGVLYGSRTVMVFAFLVLPKNLITVFGFLILLGLTGAATVPPTSGLVSCLFGAEKMATLFGISFVAHQIGSFFSAWFGGICLAATGDYVVIWIADSVLALAASEACFRIRTSTLEG